MNDNYTKAWSVKGAAVFADSREEAAQLAAAHFGVDAETFEVTEIPHAPGSRIQDGWNKTLRGTIHEVTRAFVIDNGSDRAICYADDECEARRLYASRKLNAAAHRQAKVTELLHQCADTERGLPHGWNRNLRGKIKIRATQQGN